MFVTNIQSMDKYAKVVKHVYLLSSWRSSLQEIVVLTI